MNFETTIIGVDFSGAKSDKNTWVTRGTFSGGFLNIDSCEATPRAKLADLLRSAPDNTIAALDFPFSVPKKFASRLLSSAKTMPELWNVVAHMDLQDFMAIRDEFVPEHGEPYRRGDLYFPECYSCLHKANPNMVPMTFRGMQMLDDLWRSGCRIPPLNNKTSTGPLLLESMPGAALRAFGLPFKGYKKGKNALNLRKQILNGLGNMSEISLPNLSMFHDYCLENDDCLDSVTAAVAACHWDKDPTTFRLPQDGPGDISFRGGPPNPNENELLTAQLEGWLYAPVFLNSHNRSTKN